MGAFQKDMLYSEWKSTVSTRQWVVIAMCVVRRWCVLESVNCSWSPAQCFWRFCSVVCCRYTTTLTPSCRPSSTVSTTRTPVSQWVCVLRKRLNCSVSRQSSTVFLEILQRGLLPLHCYTTTVTDHPQLCLQQGPRCTHSRQPQLQSCLKTQLFFTKPSHLSFSFSLSRLTPQTPAVTISSVQCSYPFLVFEIILNVFFGFVW